MIRLRPRHGASWVVVLAGTLATGTAGCNDEFVEHAAEGTAASTANTDPSTATSFESSAGGQASNDDPQGTGVDATAASDDNGELTSVDASTEATETETHGEGDVGALEDDEDGSESEDTGDLECPENDPYVGAVRLHPAFNLSEFAGKTRIVGTVEVKGMPQTGHEHLRCLRTIEGDFIFEPTSTTADSGISAFASLTEITGEALVSHAVGMRNMQWAHALERIGVRLILTHNDELESLDGLEQLKEVPDVAILHSPSLTSVSGLRNVERLTNGLRLYQLDALETVDGLANIVIEESLIFGQNAQLRDLSGVGAGALTKLTSVAVHGSPELRKLPDLRHVENISYLMLRGLSKLEDTQAFSGLTAIESSMVLHGLESIVELQGFRNLRSTGVFDLQGNPKLQSLAGFAALEGVGHIDIVHNQALTDVSALLGVAYAWSQFTVAGNSALDQCAALELFESLRPEQEIDMVTLANNLANLDCPDIIKP